MLNEKETTHLSKFLSLVLRHKPETINLSLGENGWTDTVQLLGKMNAAGKAIDFETLKYIVDTNSKKRFAFNEDMSRIRASQGHSLEIELGYEPQEPPHILYHGTALQNLKAILEQGLIKGNRHHVHLSTSKETAMNVGSRYGKPIVLKVQSRQMYNNGHQFFVSENDVWLTDNVPHKYIKTPEN